MNSVLRNGKSDAVPFEPLPLISVGDYNNFMSLLRLNMKDVLGTTYNQCYKTFTGLYLQVYKYRPFSKSFVAMNVVQYNILMLVFTLKNKLL